MKKYSLEEALPLIREGRIFTFYTDGINDTLFESCDAHFDDLMDAEFTLLNKKLESLDELVELDEAIFCDSKVSKNDEGCWRLEDGILLHLTDSLLDINNWERV